MENPEETLQILEEWAARRARACGGGGALPRQLDEYLAQVARTGDPVFHWASVKPLIKEKLLSAVSEFHETAPGLDVPLAPNVDPFNYEAMRALLIERLDAFTSAPFTVQRLCELLTAPRKQYNRIDKFMRAIEKNVLVVSTREPGTIRREIEEPLEQALNGSDGNSDCGVDVDMEDSTWRDARHPTVDPLAGVSERPDTVRPNEISISVPVMNTSIPEHTSPTSDDKMDETSEETQENKPEKVPLPEKTEPEPSIKEQSEESKSEPAAEMDIEVAKEPMPKLPEPLEPIEPPKTTEINETESSPKGSEDEGNSNPEPPAQSSEEAKSEPVTSGDDSSSSNSSENTDGESERGGVDSASRSPERSAASEESSSDAPEHGDGDSSPKMETEKVEIKVPIRSENYTVADIHTSVDPALETAAVAEPKALSPPPKAQPDPEKSTDEPVEAIVAPSPAEEPMQTEELTEATAQLQSE